MSLLPAIDEKNPPEVVRVFTFRRPTCQETPGKGREIAVEAEISPAAGPDTPE